MTEKMPPATQSAITSGWLPEAPATIEGVPKMPAPTMRPTIIVIASKRLSVCRGAPVCGLALTLVRPLVGGAAKLGTLRNLSGPVRLPRARSFTDPHRALDRVAAHAAVELVAQVAGAAFRLGDEVNLLTVHD